MERSSKSPDKKIKFFLFPNCYQESGIERLHLKNLEQQLAFNPRKKSCVGILLSVDAILSLFANVDE